MAGRPRTKMSIENRAKQFMPFAALKGLPDALAAKEKIVVEKLNFPVTWKKNWTEKCTDYAKG